MEQAGMNKQAIPNLSAVESELIHTSSNPHSRIAMSAFVCGIVAVSLNLLVVTAVIGFILSIISIVFGAKTYEQSSYGKAGLVLGWLSVFIIVAYVLSAVAVKIADPFL
ncbi:MAG: hypothetical protein WDZ91_12200 [Paenibacillaceae bacterium]